MMQEVRGRFSELFRAARFRLRGCATTSSGRELRKRLILFFTLEFATSPGEQKFFAELFFKKATAFFPEKKIQNAT
jgi:hypothetical protein